MYRLFTTKLRLVAPIMNPSARLFSSLPTERELRALVNVDLECRLKDYNNQFYSLEGHLPSDRGYLLTERALQVIGGILEQIKEKYGVPVLANSPEQWVIDKVLKTEKSLEEALISTVQQMSPPANCSGIEDLVKLRSAPATEPEINVLSPT